MKLRTIIIRNFRGYSAETRIPVDDFTALVGKNDVGKSTILEALDIFFGGGVVKLDASDATVGSGDSTIEIGCEFEVASQQLVIDATARTTLTEEHLLNRTGRLEIHKLIDVGGSKVKPAKVFALAHHPSTEGLEDLLELKLGALKQRVTRSGITTDTVMLNSKPSMRRALWGSTPDLQLFERLISLNEESGAEVWEQLKGALPLYALFRADRAMTDDDSEVQDPMKLAVAEAVKTVEEELDSIRDKVRANALELAGRTLDKLKAFDETLAQALNPVFKSEPKWDGFKLSLDDERGVPVNKRGSGVRRLILLSFFQAETERRRSSEDAVGVIYGIEEPEASQHPNNQRLVAQTLLELSEDLKSQVLISTHNPALADLVPVTSLRLISATETGTPAVQFGDQDVIDTACKSLGVLADPQRVKVLVHVEGPTDVDFLVKASQLYSGADGNIVNLGQTTEVCIFPIGGSNLKQWVNKQYLESTGCTEVHIYDRGTQNPARYQADVDRINGRHTNDYACLTTRRELENYMPMRLIRLLFGEPCPDLQPADNAPEILARMVHERDTAAETRPWGELQADDIDRKKLAVKKRLIKEALPQMTLEDLRVADGDGEILGWLRTITDRLG